MTTGRRACRASHLRCKRVLWQIDRSPFTRQIVQNRMRLAAKRAKVKKGVHPFAPRSARIFRCEARRRERSRSSQGLKLAGEAGIRTLTNREQETRRFTTRDQKIKSS